MKSVPVWIRLSYEHPYDHEQSDSQCLCIRFDQYPYQGIYTRKIDLHKGTEASQQRIVDGMLTKGSVDVYGASRGR